MIFLIIAVITSSCSSIIGTKSVKTKRVSFERQCERYFSKKAIYPKCLINSICSEIETKKNKINISGFFKKYNQYSIVEDKCFKKFIENKIFENKKIEIVAYNKTIILLFSESKKTLNFINFM